MNNKWNWIRLSVFMIALLVVIPAHMYGKYYYYLDQLSDSIEKNDAEAAREHLFEVNYYYNVSKKIPFGEFFTDRYLFTEAWYNEALYKYIIGDYQKVVNDLEGRQDYRAQHLIGNSLFMLARAEFLKTTDEEKKAEIIAKVVEEISPYYERSLRLMPEDVSEVDHFKDRWNYDMTSDPATAAGALSTLGKIPIFILGYPGEGDDGPGLKGKGEEGEGNPFNTAEPNEGSPPRRPRS